MVHSIITEVECECGEPAVGSILIVPKPGYDEDSYWIPVCEKHLKRAREVGCSVKYKQ